MTMHMSVGMKENFYPGAVVYIYMHPTIISIYLLKIIEGSYVT